MSAFVFNVAKGRLAHYADLPLASDTLRWMLYAATNLEADSVLQKKVSCADLVSGTTREATFTGYTTGQGLVTSTVTVSVDQTNNVVNVDDTTNPSWSPLTAQAIGKIIIAYDPDGTHTAASMIPLFADDFVLTTPTSGTVTYQVASSGFYTAS